MAKENRLWHAVNQTNLDELKELLEDRSVVKEFIDSPNKDGDSPLTQAAFLQQYGIVKILLDTDCVNIEFRNKDGRTALSLAVDAGHIGLVELLLDKEANINTQDNQGRTPLHWAVLKNLREEIINLLVQRGADTEKEDKDHRPPISYATNAATRILLLPSEVLRRRLIVCCDGTWNDRETKQPFTNVTRIHGCLEAVDRRHGLRYEQIPFYVDGIGTGTTTWGSYKAGATGEGIERKIREAYRFLCSTFANQRDEIILIGFSRGAYTIQCLAKLINDIGLIDSELVNAEFPEIFDLWSRGDGTEPLKDHDTTRDEHAGSSRDSNSGNSLKGRCQRLLSMRRLRHPVSIRAYAAWDTVKSLGVPRFGKSDNRLMFVNEQLPSNIDHAFHAMALDERRHDFQPLTLRIQNDTKRKPLAELKQCWFLGSHSDVGGGNENSGLANIPLCWMVSRLKTHVKFSQNACWYATEAGSILNIDIEKKNLEISGVSAFQSFSAPWWWARGSATRIVRKPQSGSLDTTSVSNETIHFSVRALSDLTKPGRVKSKPLKDFECSEISNSKFGWTAIGEGEKRVIREDEPDFYEIGMMQRWIDRDAHFAESVGNDLTQKANLGEMNEGPSSVPLKHDFSRPPGF